MTQPRISSDTTVLIAGFGSIGQRHFRNLRALGCQRFVFYRTRQGVLTDELAAGFPMETDLDAALAHEPQIAVIANPTSKHVEVALAAARAGCDLYIEKPLSHELHGCDELSRVVAQNNLVAMVGCQFRFHPLLVELHRQLETGRLGEVLGARAEWGEYLPGWHPWEDHRASYSARADLGGGVILTLIHPIDYLAWLFGPTVSVQSTIRAVPSLQTPAGEDWAELTLRHANGVISQVHLDYIQRPAVHQLSVWGTNGKAVWDFHAGTLDLIDLDGARQTLRVPEGFERNTMFVDAMNHFLDCVNERNTPAISLNDGIEALCVAMQAKQSATQLDTCDPWTK